MNRIPPTVAAILRATEEPVVSIGKAPGATKLGLFELTIAEVQRLPSLLEEARALTRQLPDSEHAEAFLEALEEAVRLICDYSTQYVEVWQSDVDDWRKCPGRVFTHVFKPQEFRK